MPLVKNKKYYTDRLSELKGDYQGNGWDAIDREKTMYLYPHGRNLDDEKKGSDGNRKDQYLLDNTILTAVNILVSGFFSGITPPHDKWFRLADEDKELNETDAVAGFYQKAADTILLDMSKSNFYTAIELIYKDLVTYSISNVVVDEDPDRVFNFSHIPNGQYYIDVDSRGEVSATYREFRMRARNIMAEYGEANVSEKVKTALLPNKTGGEYFTILHVIERNEGRDVTKEDNLNMPWSSITYELNGNKNDEKALRKSGYVTKPNAVPRYNVSSGNIYGNGPGDVALAAVKKLQTLTELLEIAVAKSIDPPMTSPSGVDVNTGPNELTYIDDVVNRNRPVVEPLYRQEIDISKIMALILDTQRQIREAMHSDLFFALSARNEKPQTATEIRAIQNELIRLLGPIMQRMVPELLKPLIERCFDIEFRLGRLPDIPEELQGRDIKIEIISSLTKAQELSVVAPIEQLMVMVGNMSQFWPEALNKFNAYEAIDELKRVFGIPDGIVNSDEVVAEIEALQAQQLEEEQQAIQTQEAIAGAKELSQTDMSGNNALNALIQEGAA
jgi:hypothetical protein